MASAILPPCNSVRLCAMERPRPLPSVEREPVAAHEALHQLLGGNIQGVAGDIQERDAQQFAALLRAEIGPRAGQAVLADIAQQIVEHPPEEPPVRLHTKPLGAQIKNRLDLRILQPGSAYSASACPSRTWASTASGWTVRLAGRRLGGLDEVLRQLFQPRALTHEHLEVLRRVREERPSRCSRPA